MKHDRVNGDTDVQTAEERTSRANGLAKMGEEALDTKDLFREFLRRFEIDVSPERAKNLISKFNQLIGG